MTMMHSIAKRERKIIEEIKRTKFFNLSYTEWTWLAFHT